VKAAACALLGLLAACSAPSRPDDLYDAGPSAARPAAELAVERSAAAAHTPAASRPDAAPPSADAASAAPTGSGLSAPALPSAEARHQLRVAAQTGRVRSGAAPLVEGMELAADTTLQLERGARLTLSLDDYVRLSLQGPCLARVLPGGQPAILMREGALSLDVAPRGVHGTHSAFWLGTPLARVDVADSARAFVRVSTKGGGELVLVSGHAQLAGPESVLLLAAGSAHCVGTDGLSLLSRPFTTLEQAAQVFSSGPSCAGRAGTDSARREALLSAALDAVQQREQSEVSLLAEHVRLVSLGDPRAQGVRSVLAGSAAVLVRERAWARAQHAQLSAWLIGRTPTTQQQALLARAHVLAPFQE
jgi:hypothetical protein